MQVQIQISLNSSSPQLFATGSMGNMLSSGKSSKVNKLWKLYRCKGIKLANLIELWLSKTAELLNEYYVFFIILVYELA